MASALPPQRFTRPDSYTGASAAGTFFRTCRAGARSWYGSLSSSPIWIFATSMPPLLEPGDAVSVRFQRCGPEFGLELAQLLDRLLFLGLDLLPGIEVDSHDLHDHTWFVG